MRCVIVCNLHANLKHTILPVISKCCDIINNLLVVLEHIIIPVFVLFNFYYFLFVYTRWLDELLKLRVFTFLIHYYCILVNAALIWSAFVLMLQDAILLPLHFSAVMDYICVFTIPYTIERETCLAMFRSCERPPTGTVLLMWHLQFYSFHPRYLMEAVRMSVGVMAAS